MTLAIILLGVLLVVVGLLVWQHGRQKPQGEVIFGIQDAVSFIDARLDEGTRNRVGVDGIRRIVEWELFYLRGLAQADRRNPVDTVAGEYRPAVEFIRNEIVRTSERAYTTDDVGSVLALAASYLESIGAIGKEVGGMVE